MGCSQLSLLFNYTVLAPVTPRKNMKQAAVRIYFIANMTETMFRNAMEEKRLAEELSQLDGGVPGSQ